MADQDDVRAGRSFEDTRSGRRGVITDQAGTGDYRGLYDDNPAEEMPLPPLQDMIILAPGVRRAKLLHSE